MERKREKTKLLTPEDKIIKLRIATKRRSFPTELQKKQKRDRLLN